MFSPLRKNTDQNPTLGQNSDPDPKTVFVPERIMSVRNKRIHFVYIFHPIQWKENYACMIYINFLSLFSSWYAIWFLGKKYDFTQAPYADLIMKLHIFNFSFTLQKKDNYEKRKNSIT